VVVPEVSVQTQTVILGQVLVVSEFKAALLGRRHTMPAVVVEVQITVL
jgi:hypothetical protein